MKLFRGDHVVDLIRVNSCGIDYVSCLIRAVRGLDPVSIRSLFDLLRFCVEHKLYTVVTCILRECDRQAERAYDPACRRIEGSNNFLTDVRLSSSHFISGQDLKIRNTVCHASFIKRLQCRAVFLRKAEHQG